MVDSTASQPMAHALPGLMLRLFSLESAGGRRETGQRRQLGDVHRKQVESSCLRLLYQVIFTRLSVGLGSQT